MGGSGSKYNQHGGIVIQLESSTCFGGTEITGMVHMSVQTPISPSTLYLIFKGKEKTHWEVTRTEKHNIGGQKISHTVTDYYDGKEKICNYHYPIYKWDYDMPVGGYSLPFTFLLPNNVPGSFHYASNTTLASIQYKFHAKLIGINGEKLKGRAVIQVKQASFGYNTNIQASKHANMKTWCCYDKGICKVSTVFPQDTYNPTETVNCIAEIDNSASKLDVLSVSCGLVSSIRLKCSGTHTHFVKQTIVSQTIPNVIKAGTSPLINSNVEMSLNLASRINELSEMHSTTGKLIECMYTLEVSANTEGSCMCCGDTPKVETIAKIIPNSLIEPSAPVAPPNWNPSVLQPVRLEYDQKYEVEKVEA